MRSQMYDQYSKITTRNGYPADEIISALQKSIRRAKEEDATRFAYELYISSPELEKKMWDRLITISVEDIGMGNPDAANLVYNLFQMSREFEFSDFDRPLFFTHAIRFLCQCEKDRSSDFLVNIVKKKAAMGEPLEIPDYAIDMHTQRGQRIGRDFNHFLTEASKVIPEAEVDNDYFETLQKLQNDNPDENDIPNKFKYNGWQF